MINAKSSNQTTNNAKRSSEDATTIVELKRYVRLSTPTPATIGNATDVGADCEKVLDFYTQVFDPTTETMMYNSTPALEECLPRTHLVRTICMNGGLNVIFDCKLRRLGLWTN
jgi:hypothetical protein